MLVVAGRCCTCYVFFVWKGKSLNAFNGMYMMPSQDLGEGPSSSELMQRLLNRMPCRNVHRGTPKMYSLDGECLTLAKQLIVSFRLTLAPTAASCILH